MALRNNFIPGEQVLAVDVNSIVDAIFLVQGNVLELYLENYFAGKVTPFDGLFFDGFSDSLKVGQLDAISIETVNKRIILPAGANLASVDFEKDDIEALFRTDAAQVGLDILGSFTIECWVNPESLLPPASSQVRYLFNKGGYSFFTQDRTGGEAFGVDIGADAYRLEGVNFSVVGTWTHIACVFNNSTKRVEFFVNGASVGLAPLIGTLSPINSAASAVVGKGDETANAQGWDGLIDEMRVWDVMRTATQINDNKSLIISGSSSGLQAYWRFENNFNDSSPNGNTLIESAGDTIPFTTNVPFTPPNTGFYKSILTTFQQAKKSLKLWVTRNFSARFNLGVSIAFGATTLTIAGDQTGKFANTNTIDVYDANNFVRERKTLNAVPSFAAGFTTLTFTPAIVNATGFGTSAFVERVDVKPQVSLVNFGAGDSFQDLTYSKSIVDSVNSEVEDEYTFTNSTAEEDFKAKLILSRVDASLSIYAKRLGIALTDT